MASHNQRITILENSSGININATAPIKYTGSTISADFGTAPESGSNLFLSSGTIFDALDTKINTSDIKQDLTSDGSTDVASVHAIVSALDAKQDALTIQTSLTASDTAVASADAIINALTAKQDNITSATAINCGDLNINGNTNATGYIYCNAAITSTSSIASPVVIQGTTNLLNKINTKQDIINTTTNITTNNLDITGTLSVTGQATLNALTVSNAIVSTGSFVTTSGNIITQTGYIKATAGDITTTNGNITATNGNIVVSNGDITASLGDIVATSGTIQGAVITGDIFGNLDAGSGITLTANTPTTGKTRISAAAVNAFSTSTEYAFQASGPSSNQVVGVGARVNFNSNQIIKPAGSTAYSNSQRSYTIESSGTYVFGFKLFIQGQVEDFRVGIIKTGVGGGTIAMGGRSADMTENVTIMAECLVGEEVWVEGIVGSASVFTGNTLSWFYGYKLQPETNTIGASTDLTVKDVITEDMTVTGTLTAPNIEGFTKSTEYGFKATCDYESVPISTIVTIPGGATVPFNEHSALVVTPMSAYCIPNVTAYNQGTAEYTVPVSGYYLFGWRIFVLSSPTTIPHLRFTINNGIGVQVGEYAANNESCTFQGYFEAGNTIRVSNGGSGSIDLDLARTRSYWYGHKLTPANNLITSTTDLSIQNLSVADDMTATNITSTNISAGNISANTTTFNSMTAYTFESENAYFINNAFGAPGTADAQPGFIFKNGPALVIQGGHTSFPGTINFTTNGTITNMIYDGNLNISSTANISDISATNLTLSNALTGAANINITGDISADIISGTTITGNIAGNLSQGTGIVLTTAAGVTNISNSLPYETPISRIFSRTQSSSETPSTGSSLYYTTFNASTPAVSPHVTYVAPNIDTGGANTGFIIQTAGTYKVTFTICVHSVSYTNRVSWWSRLLKNNATTGIQTFIYTRSDSSQYAQYGSNSTTYISNFAVNDYLLIQTLVAKNSALYNNNFDGLRGVNGSQFTIELIS